MKRIVFTLIVSFFFLIGTNGQTIWTGGGGNMLWSNAANWNPMAVPGITDDVTFNTSATVTIDVSPNINSLLITGNSSVIFVSSVSQTILLNSTASSPKGLQINFNSTLTFDCINNSLTNNLILSLTGTNGVTGLVDGNLYFKGSGGSAGSSARFVTTTGLSVNANMQVSATGYIKFFDNTGNASTSPTSFTMQNGATYEIAKDGGTFPNGSWASNSIAKFINLTGPNGASFVAAEYGDLEWNSTALTSTNGFLNPVTFNNVNLISTNNAPISLSKIFPGIKTMIVKGDLTLGVNSKIELTDGSVSSGNGGRIELRGTLINSGTINTNGVAGTINDFELSGTVDQSITSSGTFTGNVNFIMNNSAGATLLTDLSLPYRYSIDTGNLTLANNDLITPEIIQISPATLTSNHIVTNGTGVLTIQNILAGTIAFPVGPSSDSLNTLSITNGSGSNFSVRVEKGIVPSIAFPTYGINRTWSIFASTVTPNVTVTFQYATSDANPSALPQPQNMEILMNSDPITSGPWSIITGNGSIAPGGADPAFTIQSSTGLIINNSRVTYALGISGGYILPIDFFINATSQKRDDNAIINWKVFETSNINSFEVQRSINNSGFITIASINPTTNLYNYSFTDLSLDKGTNIYRIKVNQLSGGVRYSNQVAVINDTKGILITSVIPNPIQNDNAKISLSAAKQGIVQFKIYDVSGNFVKQWYSNIIEGNNTLKMDVAELARGIYIVMAYTLDSRNSFRFIKQ